MAEAEEQSLGPDSKSSEPVVVAEAIWKVVTADRPKPRFAVGYLGKFLLGLNRVLPDRAWDWVATRRDKPRDPGRAAVAS